MLRSGGEGERIPAPRDFLSGSAGQGEAEATCGTLGDANIILQGSIQMEDPRYDGKPFAGHQGIRFLENMAKRVFGPNEQDLVVPR